MSISDSSHGLPIEESSLVGGSDVLQSQSIIQSQVHLVSVRPVLVRLPLAALLKFCQHHDCLYLNNKFEDYRRPLTTIFLHFCQ